MTKHQPSTRTRTSTALVSVQKHPISAAKKKRSPGTAVCRLKTKTEAQTGRLPPPKKNEAANWLFAAPKKTEGKNLRLGR
jgi:hypothetical protein